MSLKMLSICLLSTFKDYTNVKIFLRIGLIGLVSTQKKKSQRKLPKQGRLQDIQIFENIHKKRKLSSPSKPLATLPTGTHRPVSHHYLEGYTKPQSPGLFLDKENQFNSPLAPTIFLQSTLLFTDLCQLKNLCRSLYS